MAPLLALDFIVGLFAFGTTWSSNSIVGQCLFVFCVIATIGWYGYWAIKEPDRLQTEDYRLSKHRIDVIGDERNPNDIKVIQAAPTPNTHLAEARVEAAK
jgi:hypothetical protein